MSIEELNKFIIENEIESNKSETELYLFLSPLDINPFCEMAGNQTISSLTNCITVNYKKMTAIIVICCFALILSLIGNSGQQSESYTDNYNSIQSCVITEDDELFVNGKQVDISSFKGEKMTVVQTNGKLTVNGRKYDFKTKSFK